MKLHLHSRLYYLIWKLWPKCECIVDGRQIIYAVLPWWLLVCWETKSKSFFVKGGMCVVHRFSGTQMIFVSRPETNSSKLRYVLLHEHLESSYFLYGWKKEDMKELQRAIISLGSEVEGVLSNAMEQSRAHPHYLALTIELALAKKEMSPNDFSEYLNYALKNCL